MIRVFALLLLAGFAAPMVAAEPEMRFALPERKLEEPGKFRLGRQTHFMTGVLAFSPDGDTVANFTNQHYTAALTHLLSCGT